MTFEIAINILITAILGYITLNTIFRYHFSSDRIIFLGAGLIFIGCLYYRGTDKMFESFITLGLIILLVVILKIISLRKQRHGFFLLNTYNKQYKDVKTELYTLAEEFKIDKKNINYNIQKPWLVLFTNTKAKTIRKFMVKLDKIFTHKPLKFTMYNYWFVLVYIVIITITWRF